MRALWEEDRDIADRGHARRLRWRAMSASIRTPSAGARSPRWRPGTRRSRGRRSSAGCSARRRTSWTRRDRSGDRTGWTSWPASWQNRLFCPAWTPAVGKGEVTGKMQGRPARPRRQSSQADRLPAASTYGPAKGARHEGARRVPLKATFLSGASKPCPQASSSRSCAPFSRSSTVHGLDQLDPRKPDGTPRMREIAAAVKEGARAYLNRQYTTIGIVGVVVVFVMGWALDGYTAAASRWAPCFRAARATSA